MKHFGGEIFRASISSGALEIENHRAEVNDLNVFPVPDGDTGSNMEATMKGGVASMQGLGSEDCGPLAEKMAYGMLLSARGNSGVILSQFFAGFAKALSSRIEIDVPCFQKAMEEGVKTAYAAVVNPTEGTMLTVMREGAEKAKPFAKPDTDFDAYMPVLIQAMQDALKRTPTMLPVLKEAGVIDSGGQGFVYIFQGIAEALSGKIMASLALNHSGSDHQQPLDLSAYNESSHLDYGYCTEFLLQLTKEKADPASFDKDALIAFLEKIGDSIVCFQTGTLVKVHIHTKEPDQAIAYAKQFGDFVTFKMENMALQHNETLAKREERAEEAKKNAHEKIAAVAVSPSEGVSKMFRDYGASVILESGELMNPSGEDFLKAFDQANADNIFVFPNNKNEIMTAHQAAKLYTKSWIYVIETQDIPQGLAAASVMDVSSFSVEENLSAMEDEMKKVQRISLTRAAHDSRSFGLEIHQNDYMGLLNGKIVVANSSMKECFKNLLQKVSAYSDASLITLVFGKRLLSEEKAALEQIAIEENDWIEVAKAEGGQDLYCLYGIVE